MSLTPRLDKIEKNWCLNGSFDFWQRGNSGILVNSYGPDRWYHYGGPNVTMSRVASGLSRTDYAMRLQRDNGIATSGQTSAAGTSLEIRDVRALAGKKVTVQLKYRTGAGITGQAKFTITWSTNGDQRANFAVSETVLINELLPNSASFSTLIRTVDLPASAVGFSVHMANESTSTAGADDYVDVAEVMILSGERTEELDFVRAGYDFFSEYQQCQRFYEKSFNLDTPPQVGFSDAGFEFLKAGQSNINGTGPFVTFKVQKRGIPTIQTYSNASTTTNSAIWYHISGSGDVSGGAVFAIGTRGYGYNAVGGPANQNEKMWHWTADAEF